MLYMDKTFKPKILYLKPLLVKPKILITGNIIPALGSPSQMRKIVAIM